jgi:hypothetical protein
MASDRSAGDSPDVRHVFVLDEPSATVVTLGSGQRYGTLEELEAARRMYGESIHTVIVDENLPDDRRVFLRTPGT